MKLDDFQREQQRIEQAVIAEAVRLHPQHAEAIRSHAWSLDLSDMTWECGGCFAVLHAGERRFKKCSGERGI